MNTYKVLVADDEASIRKINSQVLQGEGIDVATSGDGAQTVALASGTCFDLIILDIMMGQMDGFDVIKALRGLGVYTPILILSAKSEDTDKVYALGIGADDYVTKPFSPMVLTAKVKAMLRRHADAGHFQNVIVLPPFRYVQNEMRLFKNGEEILLTTKENLLMRLFMTEPRHILNMEQIYVNVWGNNVVDNNTIMVHIQHLRKKIEDDPQQPRYIRTVRGLGYQFFTDERA